MKKKVCFLMLTLIAMITSLSLVSCDKDDEPANTDNYYFVLVNVRTNIVDANGESLVSALRDEWIKDFNADSGGQIQIGKNTTEEAAAKAFDQSIVNMKNIYAEAYAGKNLLPEGGFIVYNFALVSELGRTCRTAFIRVTNSGAE